MSYSNGPKIVTRGLVFYYDAANGKSFVGVSGSWNDLTENGFNTTDRCSTGTQYNSGSINNAVRGFLFDGTKTRFRRDVEGVLFSGSYNFTWECWAYPYSTSGQKALIGRRSTADDMLAVNGSAIWLSRAQVNAVQGGTFVANTWNHIAGSGNSSNLYVYLNGVKVGTGTNTSAFTGNFLNWYIGCLHDAYGEGSLANPFSGSIALAKCYSTQLTDDEIFQNYNATKGRFRL